MLIITVNTKKKEISNEMHENKEMMNLNSKFSKIKIKETEIVANYLYSYEKQIKDEYSISVELPNLEETNDYRIQDRRMLTDYHDKDLEEYMNIQVGDNDSIETYASNYGSFGY
jgi:hypothetical protein